jgi:hypothetical protein
MCLACDRHQAGILFRYIAGYFETLALKAMVTGIGSDYIELCNDVSIEVHTNSFRSRFIRCRFLGDRLGNITVRVLTVQPKRSKPQGLGCRCIEKEEAMNIGFIGLGHMGSSMAANLVKAGHDVTVYNRTRAKLEPLIAQGAKVAVSVSDACRGDAVITMLASDDAVENVVVGDDGIVASLPAGAIHISSSTISVALSEVLARRPASASLWRRYSAARTWRPRGNQ